MGLCSFINVRSDFYWSAATRVTQPSQAWMVNLAAGEPDWFSLKANVQYLWPVRGGQ
jgi:hypothetical protein